jgi:hypothetical protein
MHGALSRGEGKKEISKISECVWHLPISVCQWEFLPITKNIFDPVDGICQSE